MKLSLLEFCKERSVTIQVPISDERQGRRSAERKRLANEWKRLGLGRIASRDIAPPPSRGFIRAYHFVEAKHGLSDIIAQRLKVARFSDLNDPFELLGLNSHERLIRRVAKSHKKDQIVTSVYYASQKTGMILYFGATMLKSIEAYVLASICRRARLRRLNTRINGSGWN